MSHQTQTTRSLAALALTASALMALSTVAVAAPPSPTADVTASCVNNDPGNGNYNQIVDVDIDAAYKGRWVDFHVTVTVPSAGNSPKHRPIVRHDSTSTWSDGFNFLTTGGQATSASVEVQVLDNKGQPVGDPGNWNGTCLPAASG